MTDDATRFLPVYLFLPRVGGHYAEHGYWADGRTVVGGLDKHTRGG